MSDCIPNITVVIPLHNAESYIVQALTSLKEQTYPNWSCIIVNDDSTDNSVSLALSNIAGDDRFVFLERKDQTNVKGANACRNIGLYIAKTAYAMFLDADDYLSRTCMEQRTKVINDDENLHDIYVFKTAFVNNEGKITGYFYNPNEDIPDMICRLVKHQIPWHTMSPVWSVNFLKNINGWNEEYERLQDVELNIRALLHYPMIRFINDVPDSYYRTNGMSQGKKTAARRGFCRLVRDYYKLLTSNKKIEERHKIIIAEKFQNILEAQFLGYIKFAQERDKKWEELYLSTLSALEVDNEDQLSIKHIFSKI